MKKSFKFFSLIIALLAVFQTSAQNLIPNWHGNGITGTNSEANKWGWSSTYASATWNQADVIGGVRFRAVSGVTRSPSGTFSGREFIYRWDSPYNGSTLALGIGNGTSTTSTGISLTAHNKYNFTGLARWIDNGNAPTYTFKISDAKSGGNAVTLGTHSCAVKTTFYPFSLSFTPSTTGTYFIQVTQTAGFSGGADLGGLIGLADLSFVVNTTPDLIVSKKYMFFDNSTDGLTETFTVSSNQSATDITLTAPAGITLSKTTLTPAEAQVGTTITATYDNSVHIASGRISISNGTLSDAITIDAVKNNLIGSWDADGSVDATASIPTNNGWASSGTITWVAANVGTVGSVRYMDNPAGYTYNGNTYYGRALWLRWDWAHSQVTNAVYSLPVSLQTGKTYAFKGKLSWHDNDIAPVNATIRINSAANNSGATYGISTTELSTKKVVAQKSLEFSVPETGTYYLTFTCNKGSLNSYSDLAIYEVSEVSNVNMLVDRADFNLVSNYTVSSVTVRPEYKFTVDVGATLNAASLVLESNATQNATFVNNGSANITSATVQQHFTSGRNWYFASPVSAATSNVIKGTEGNQLWERNVADNAWTEITATDAALTPGRGYIAKVAGTGVVSFTGALNNGQVQYPISSHGVTSGKFHLVGNPYPSYLDWQSVVTSNPDVMPTMWFRTKTASDAYMFATVLMSDGSPIVTAVNAASTVTKLIPPMQGFWVRINDVVESTNFTVNNTMRSHADQSGNRFKAPANQNQLLRLEISNGTNNDEAVLYFNGNASDAFDRYDSPKMFNNNAVIPEIYTRAGNERLVINGMNGYDFNTMIPLGFVAGQAGSFSIRSSELQNFDSDTQVYLLDKTSNSQFNLTSGESYSFTSDATSTEDRFAVLFKSASGTSSVGDNAVSGMYLSAQNGRLTLQLNTAIDNAQATVFTAAGQSIHSQAVSAPTTVLNKSLDAGVYVVKIVNGGRTTVLRTIMH